MGYELHRHPVHSNYDHLCSKEDQPAAHASWQSSGHPESCYQHLQSYNGALTFSSSWPCASAQGADQLTGPAQCLVHVDL